MNINDLVDVEIKSIVSKLNENNIVKNSDIKRIISNSVLKALCIHDPATIESIDKIKSKFSGKGNVWIKITPGNSIWDKAINALELNSDNTFCFNLKDMFEENKIGWIRFSNVNKKQATFHIRHMGSKFDDHIKCYLNHEEAINSTLLYGNPHKLGLEKGSFKEEEKKKEVINIPVSKEELSKFGIQTLEDLF